MEYLEKLLNWSMFLGESNNGNIRGLNFVYFFGEVCSWFVSIIIIVFCKIISCERFFFLCF